VTAAPEPEPLLVPVGHLLGTFYSVAGSPVRRTTVQLGGALHDLDDDELTVWLLAHGLPDRPAEAWTEDAVAAAAVELALPEAPPVLRRLRDRGLVVPLRTVGPEAVGFARTYRVVPSMLGLGNSPESPGDYQIGLFGHPVLHLPDPLYDLWRWSPVDVHLWNACRGATDVARQAGRTDPDETVPELLLDVFLQALHLLLSTQAAHLDLARTAAARPAGGPADG